MIIQVIFTGESERRSVMRVAKRAVRFPMNAKQQVGVVLLVAAVLAGVWSVNRYTGLVGQLHSWSPPFNQYEVVTIVGALAAVLCLVSGLRMVSGKKPKKSET